MTLSKMIYLVMASLGRADAWYVAAAAVVVVATGAIVVVVVAVVAATKVNVKRASSSMAMRP